LPSGLVALLDDVAVIAKAASASVDDVSLVAGRAGSKVAGVVIDDAAVTPSYVVGISPARELPVIWKITKGSLINKLVILLPVALLLSQFLPWLITPILMLGGAFLCYEGAEKVMEKFGGEKHGKTLDDEISDPSVFEKQRVRGAIRTDLILSAEIMAITLNEVSAESLLVRAMVLALIGFVITLVVYGAVAIIVKTDDVGLHLTKKDSAFLVKFGRVLLLAMPKVLILLSVVGTVAMLWVGGGILSHGSHELGWHTLFDAVQGIKAYFAASAGPFLGFLAEIAALALLGLVAGLFIATLIHKIFKLGSNADEQSQLS
jgi:predicted DNA repair protein MutK